jgi:hypothetical protein
LIEVYGSVGFRVYPDVRLFPTVGKFDLNGVIAFLASWAASREHGFRTFACTDYGLENEGLALVPRPLRRRTSITQGLYHRTGILAGIRVKNLVGSTATQFPCRMLYTLTPSLSPPPLGFRCAVNSSCLLSCLIRVRIYYYYTCSSRRGVRGFHG